MQLLIAVSASKETVVSRIMVCIRVVASWKGETDFVESVIWFGDFNYRVGLGLEMAKDLVRRQDLGRLYENDQVCLASFLHAMLLTTVLSSSTFRWWPVLPSHTTLKPASTLCLHTSLMLGPTIMTARKCNLLF